MREKNRRMSTTSNFKIITTRMLPLNHRPPLPEPEPPLLPEFLTGLLFDSFPDFLRMGVTCKTSAKVKQSGDLIEIVLNSSNFQFSQQKLTAIIIQSAKADCNRYVLLIILPSIAFGYSQMPPRVVKV